MLVALSAVLVTTGIIAATMALASLAMGFAMKAGASLPWMLAAALGTGATARAADFTVSNLNDSGAGSLRQAVAASIAIPGVIAGPEINGRVMVDGGVINPLPVDHLKKDCDITIAVDVTGKPSPGPSAPASRATLSGIPMANRFVADRSGVRAHVSNP